MGFKSVYRCLQEVFPEMDTRILKAVAIEHSKDADAAVNDILTEVLPYMNRQSTVRNSSPRVEIEENRSLLGPHPVAEVSEAGPSSGTRCTICETAVDSARTNGTLPADITRLNEVDDAGPSSEQRCTAVENAENSGCTDGPTDAELALLYEMVDDSKLASESRFIVREKLEDSARTGPPSDQKCTTIENAENSGCINGAAHADLKHVNEVVDAGLASEPRFIVGENEEDSARTNGVFHTENCGSTSSMSHSDLPHPDGVVKALSSAGLSSTTDENAKNSDRAYTAFLVDLTHLDKVVNEYNVSGSHILNDSNNQSGRNTMDEELILLGKTCEMKNVELCQNSISSPHEKDGRLNDPNHEWKDLEYSMANDVDWVAHEGSGKLDACLDGSTECNLPSEFPFDPTFNEDDFAGNSAVTESGEICRIDILDEIIEDARNNKKLLFSAMESVINMMKEVELQERAAEQAKEEAAKGGLDILIKVEELKQMLGHAKETNDMHSGEVYGEKAILATEVKELQSRLLCLSDERDKSLSTLDEMCQILEARLAVAEDLKKSAEQEKLEKEGLARRALAEQEAIMEKVVQESKLLEKEAEENSKLREFLVDRGRMVDILQGEISVICQDVGVLKEKFDQRLPLSMSVSSSQTSCKLASSSSSLKSMGSVLVPEERESPKSLEKESPVSPTSDRSRAEEDNKVESDDKELLEDEWDIFDKDAELDVRPLINRA